MAMSIFYEELTSRQLKELQTKNTILLFSLGSIEQHSSHLPVGTDYLCSRKRVANIASRSNSIVFSPIQLGYSFNHSGMFSTVSLSAETLLIVLREIFTQLCEQGWKRFMIFSGHAGNWGVVEVAIQMVREKYPLSQFIITRGLPSLGVQHEKERFCKNFDLHAGKVETALISYFFPNLLDKENIPPANSNLPQKLKKLISSDTLDEFDLLLARAYTPQKTSELSTHGNWGVQDPHNFTEIPVEEAMKKFEDFFVKLISRWNKWEN